MESDQPQQVEHRVQTVCLLILSAVAVAFALYYLRTALIPVVLAFMLTMVLSPVVSFQVDRLRFPHAIAVAATMLLGIAVIALIYVVVSVSLTQLTNNLSKYESRLEQITERLKRTLRPDDVEVQPAPSEGTKSKWPNDQVPPSLPPTTPKSPEKKTSPLEIWPDFSLGDALRTLLGAVFNIVSQGVLMLIFLFFLLMGQAARPVQPSKTWAEIEYHVKKYLLTKTFLSAVTGILVWVILRILQVELALVFGLLAFLLNFIPSIGSIISTLLPLPIAVLNPEISTATASLAITWPGATQFVIGTFIEPRMLGDSLDLHPVPVLLALVFWGTLWGPVGMLLAAPMTAILRVLVEKLEITAPIGQLLAGRPGRDAPPKRGQDEPT